MRRWRCSATVSGKVVSAAIRRSSGRAITVDGAAYRRGGSDAENFDFSRLSPADLWLPATLNPSDKDDYSAGLPDVDRPLEERRNSRAGAIRDDCDRAPSSRETRRARAAAGETVGHAAPGRNRGKRAHDAFHPPRRGRICSPHRLRKRRQPATGADEHAPARAGDSRGFGRDARPVDPSTPRRKIACSGCSAAPLESRSPGFGLDLLLRLLPLQLPRSRRDLAERRRPRLFSLGVSLLTGFLFGLAPAWQISQPDLQAPLKEGGRAATPRSRAPFAAFSSSPRWRSLYARGQRRVSH